MNFLQSSHILTMHAFQVYTGSAPLYGRKFEIRKKIGASDTENTEEHLYSAPFEFIFGTATIL